MPRNMTQRQRHWLETLPRPPSLSSLAKQRVAVCMVGATRTMVLPSVYRSVKQNLIDAQMVSTDLFLHIHLTWDHTKFAAGMGHHGAAGEAISHKDEKLRAAIAHLMPVDVHFTTSSGCDHPEMAPLQICQQVNRGRAGGIALRQVQGLNSSYMPVALTKLPNPGELAGYLQFMWTHRSLSRVIKYEAESLRGDKYAWIIRTRPDLAFFDLAPPAVTMTARRMVLMQKESNPSYFDGFWMAPRWLLPEVMDSIDAFWHTLPSLPWPPEWSYFPYLSKVRNVPWGYAPIPAVLVRGPHEADCWRLQQKETPQFLYDMQGSMWGRAPHAMSTSRTNGEGKSSDTEEAPPAALQQRAGELISFRRACEMFFGMPRGGGGGGRGGGGSVVDSTFLARRPGRYTQVISVLRPLMQRSNTALQSMQQQACERDTNGSSWAQVPGNVPTPIREDRCAVRFATLEEAKRACCAQPQCEAVVSDGGLICPRSISARFRGAPSHQRLAFELRRGLSRHQREKVRHIGAPSLPAASG